MLATKLHPGDHLRELLAEYNISQSYLARHIDVKVGVINEICNGKRGISVQISQRLGLAFGCSPEFWLNLQMAYELGRSKKRYKITKIVGNHAA